jgi:hypothetical protein
MGRRWPRDGFTFGMCLAGLWPSLVGFPCVLTATSDRNDMIRRFFELRLITLSRTSNLQGSVRLEIGSGERRLCGFWSRLWHTIVFSTVRRNSSINSSHRTEIRLASRLYTRKRCLSSRACSFLLSLLLQLCELQLLGQLLGYARSF